MQLCWGNPLSNGTLPAPPSCPSVPSGFHHSPRLTNPKTTQKKPPNSLTKTRKLLGKACKNQHRAQHSSQPQNLMQEAAELRAENSPSPQLMWKPYSQQEEGQPSSLWQAQSGIESLLEERVSVPINKNLRGSLPKKPESISLFYMRCQTLLLDSILITQSIIVGFISVLNTSIDNIYPFQSQSSPKTKAGVFFDPAVQKVSAA